MPWMQVKKDPAGSNFTYSLLLQAHCNDRRNERVSRCGRVKQGDK